MNASLNLWAIIPGRASSEFLQSKLNAMQTDAVPLALQKILVTLKEIIPHADISLTAEKAGETEELIIWDLSVMGLSFFKLLIDCRISPEEKYEDPVDLYVSLMDKLTSDKILMRHLANVQAIQTLTERV